MRLHPLVFALAGWCMVAATPGNPMDALVQAVAQGKYVLQLDGKPLSSDPEIALLVDASEVVPYKDGEDGTMHTRPGNPKPGKMTVTKDWSNTSEWYVWRRNIAAGKVDRRSISVIFHNDAGQEARVNLLNCWPVRWELVSLNAKSSGHATEKLEIVWETIELK